MLFLLNIILIINLFISIRYFKNLVAPPTLMGGGMLIATLMATSYYDAWDMEEMLPITVLIIGCGTFFFTLCCILFSKVFPIQRQLKISYQVVSINYQRLRFFYIFSIIIGLIGILLQIHYLRSGFGSLNLAELIYSKRIDEWSGTNSFTLPGYVRQLGSYTSVLSYFTLWLLALNSTNKITSTRKLNKILLLHLCVVFVNGMLSGAKASILEIPCMYVVFYLYSYYAFNGTFRLHKKICLKFTLLLALIVLSFKSLSLMLGRVVDDESNTDLFAVYCGAQIKNFDIIMHQKTKVHNKKWGENTFVTLHSELDPKFKMEPGEYYSVGDFNLGNVYTQYEPYYMDFGLPGVFFMNLFVAFFSMFFYSKSQKTLSAPNCPNIYILIYASMSMALLMGFFSGKFTEGICRLGWMRTIVYLSIMVWFIKKYLFKRSV